MTRAAAGTARPSRKDRLAAQRDGSPRPGRVRVPTTLNVSVFVKQHGEPQLTSRARTFIDLATCTLLDVHELAGIDRLATINGTSEPSILPTPVSDGQTHPGEAAPESTTSMESSDGGRRWC